MPNGDPQDGFFYPILILMIDSYILAHRTRISEILPWVRKSYLTQAILPRLSHEEGHYTLVVLELTHMVVR